jgi:DNA polymerase-1
MLPATRPAQPVATKEDAPPDLFGAAPPQAAVPAGGATTAAEASPANILRPAMRAGEGAKAAAVPFDRSKYETITDLARLDAWIAEARAAGRVAVDTSASSADPMQAELCGISLGVVPGRACYVPLGHRNGDDLLGGLAPGQVDRPVALARLKPLLEDRAILKIAQNLKFDTILFARHGIEVAPYDDTMLIAYALEGGTGGYATENLAQKLLGYAPISLRTSSAPARRRSRLTGSLSTGPPNIRPRTPTSPCACGPP